MRSWTCWRERARWYRRDTSPIRGSGTSSAWRDAAGGRDSNRRFAGELAEGTVTWMVGPKTLESHIVPRITTSAQNAGRPEPRIVVGLPIAVTDDTTAAIEAARGFFGRYNDLPSYRSMLDIEGVEHPADMAIVGNEGEVERQLRVVADVGATDLLASIFPVGDNAEAAVSRTRALLKSLLGKI